MEFNVKVEVQYPQVAYVSFSFCIFGAFIYLFSLYEKQMNVNTNKASSETQNKIHIIQVEKSLWLDIVRVKVPN